MAKRTRLLADGGTVVAEVTSIAAPLPARFAAPIEVRPGRIGGFVPDAPPEWWIVDRVRVGDAQMQSRVLDACARLRVADEDIAAGFIAHWLAGFSATAAGLSFARRTLAEGGPLRPSLRARLLESLRWRARFDPTVAALVGTEPEPGTPQAAAPTEASRDTQEPAADDDGWGYLFDGGGDRLLYDAPELVARAPEGALALLHRRPDALVEVIVALQSYIEQPRHASRWDRLCRLDVLAQLHKDSAREVVERTDDLRPLLRFFSPGSLVDYAARHGLPLVAGGVPGGRPSAALADRVVLDTAVGAEHVTRKTSQYPCGGDDALRRLAALVPALDGALFEEVPHLGDDEDEGRDDDAGPDGQLADRYRWRAWWRDERFEVIGGDTSSWLDVPALAGLLNALLARTADARRFHMLLDDGYSARLLLAAPAGVSAAVDDGVLSVLVDTGGADDE